MTEFDTLLGMELISKKNYNDKGILETEMFYDLKNVLVQHVTYNENGDQIKIMNFVNGVLSAVD